MPASSRADVSVAYRRSLFPFAFNSLVPVLRRKEMNPPICNRRLLILEPLLLVVHPAAGFARRPTKSRAAIGKIRTAPQRDRSFLPPIPCFPLALHFTCREVLRNLDGRTFQNILR